MTVRDFKLNQWVIQMPAFILRQSLPCLVDNRWPILSHPLSHAHTYTMVNFSKGNYKTNKKKVQMPKFEWLVTLTITFICLKNPFHLLKQLMFTDCLFFFVASPSSILVLFWWVSFEKLLAKTCINNAFCLLLRFLLYFKIILSESFQILLAPSLYAFSSLPLQHRVALDWWTEMMTGLVSLQNNNAHSTFFLSLSLSLLSLAWNIVYYLKPCCFRRCVYKSYRDDSNIEVILPIRFYTTYQMILLIFFDCNIPLILLISITNSL